MPLKPLRPCRSPGCSALTRDGYCNKHRKQEAHRYDKHRGTATQRGYGVRWRRYRLRFLQDNPLCVECLREKPRRLTAATEVDHIKAVSGPDDPLFWDEGNHQALCKSCHSRKTAKENGGMGNATTPRGV